MTCNEIENRLPAYREDLLPPGERKIISGHLASCPRCNRTFLDLKKAEALVRGLGEVEPPPFFEQRIMSRVREEAVKKQGVLRRLFYPLYIKIPIQAMATLLVAVLTIYVYQSGEPETKQKAPLPIPMTDQGKDLLTAEAPRVLPPPPVATPTKRAPAGNLPDASRQRFVTPPPKAGGKEERAADSRAVMQKEHLSAMKPADPLIPVKEKEAPPAGEETSNRTMDKAGKQHTDQAFETLPQEPKRKDRTGDTGARVRESAKTAAAPSPSRMTAAATIKKRPVIDLTLRVGDADVALRETEARLGRVNARIIDRKGSEFLTVEVAAQNVAALLELFEAIGRVSLETGPFVVTDGDVTVSIKIVAHQ
jgi:hypothetical protein